ncbi:MAG: NAD(P)-dependent oxidoreductase [Gemmatales bacterium]|nr:NAD(P)-dependent oxidoreductase [Gemmatales bacterium]MDW7993460.1 NAD(P)-dependent oxidoreductase [Gemmatales bacterium]
MADASEQARAPQLVLVTGSAGRVGRAVVAALLAQGHRVRGFDRLATPGLSDQIIADITDRAVIRHACQQVHTLIHLAATPDDVAEPVQDLFGPNIVGTYEVLEAARLAGVRRLIVASTAQVVWHQRERGPFPIRVTDPVTPRSWYAATKVFLEAASRALQESFGLEVIVARLGWCPRSREQVEEIYRTSWAPDVYLSPEDVGRFFACAVSCTLPAPYYIVFVTSRPAHREILDLEPARRLGYQPQHTWPEGLPSDLLTA